MVGVNYNEAFGGKVYSVVVGVVDVDVVADFCELVDIIHWMPRIFQEWCGLLSCQIRNKSGRDEQPSGCQGKGC